MESQAPRPAQHHGPCPTMSQDTWQEALVLMTLALQDELQGRRTAPSPEIERTGQALQEYVLRETRPTALALIES